jgi:hypothetical protein
MHCVRLMLVLHYSGIGRSIIILSTGQSEIDARRRHVTPLMPGGVNGANISPFWGVWSLFKHSVRLNFNNRDLLHTLNPQNVSVCP